MRPIDLHVRMCSFEGKLINTSREHISDSSGNRKCKMSGNMGTWAGTSRKDVMRARVAGQ